MHQPFEARGDCGTRRHSVKSLGNEGFRLSKDVEEVFDLWNVVRAEHALTHTGDVVPRRPASTQPDRFGQNFLAGKAVKAGGPCPRSSEALKAWGAASSPEKQAQPEEGPVRRTRPYICVGASGRLRVRRTVFTTGLPAAGTSTSPRTAMAMTLSGSVNRSLLCDIPP